MSTNWPPGTDSFSTTIAGGDSMAGVHAALHDKIAAALNALEAKTGLVKLAELSGAAANYDFTSIPSGYRALLLEVYARSDAALTLTSLVVQFNADTAGNYDVQSITGTGSTAAAGEGLGITSVKVGDMPGASAVAGSFSAVRCDIPAYANTTGHKTVASSCAAKNANASGGMETAHFAGFWRNTAAINEIKLIPGSGNFATGSQAVLYGVL